MKWAIRSGRLRQGSHEKGFRTCLFIKCFIEGFLVMDAFTFFARFPCQHKFRFLILST